MSQLTVSKPVLARSSRHGDVRSRCMAMATTGASIAFLAVLIIAL